MDCMYVNRLSALRKLSQDVERLIISILEWVKDLPQNSFWKLSKYIRIINLIHKIISNKT